MGVGPLIGGPQRDPLIFQIAAGSGGIAKGGLLEKGVLSQARVAGFLLPPMLLPNLVTQLVGAKSLATQFLLKPPFSKIPPLYNTLVKLSERPMHELGPGCTRKTPRAGVTCDKAKGRCAPREGDPFLQAGFVCISSYSELT